MAKLFYEGNKETLQFKAEDKRGTLKPYHSFVSIFNDEEQLVFDAPVQINDNELSFAILLPDPNYIFRVSKFYCLYWYI